jgi:hypothetical protein
MKRLKKHRKYSGSITKFTTNFVDYKNSKAKIIKISSEKTFLTDKVDCLLKGPSYQFRQEFFLHSINLQVKSKGIWCA